MIIQKVSDKTTYILEGGKLISLAGGGNQNHGVPILEVSDAVFTRLVTAYGAVVT
jgi:hypothetical protein